MKPDLFKGNSMRPVYALFVLLAVFILIGVLDAYAAPFDTQTVPSFELEPGMRVGWTENEPPTSLTDRCQSVHLAKAGAYKVEIQSPALASGLWIENDTAEAHLIARTVGVRFQVCRPGFVTVCELSSSALGPVEMSVDEDPDPLEVIVDEDPFRIDLCDPWLDSLEARLETMVDEDP